MKPHIDWAVAIFVGGCALLVAGLFHMIPQWTRPDIYFSVTVPPAFRTTPEARRILRSYRIRVWLATLVSFSAIFVAAKPALAFFALLGVTVLVAGSFAALLAARKKVMPHCVAPSTVRVASLAPRPTHLPGGWLAQAGPFAILFAMGLWLRVHWDQIPERFPVHWDLYGIPNRWSGRTASGIYGPLIVSSTIVGMLALLAYGILMWSRQVSTDAEAARAKTDFMHRMLIAMLALEYGMAVLFSFIAGMPLIGQQAIGLMLAVVTIFFGGVVVMVAWLSRNRNVVPTHMQTASDSYAEVHHAGSVPNAVVAGDGTADECWKWGVIYYNPNDAALFVEKRFGVGYTMNFGRPMSWVILSLILVVPIAVALIAVAK